MTNINEIQTLAINAYCNQFNATIDRLDDIITPDDCESIISAIDPDFLDNANAYRIQITNDDCAIDILAIRITITDDRFATNDETFKFFLSADHTAYIPLP